MATKATNPIPEGFHTLTPYLVCRNAPEAIEFYKKGLGAEVKSVNPGPDGRILNAELKIGDSIFMLAEEFPEFGSHSPEALNGSSVTLHIYTANPDSLFDQAVAAGAKVAMPMMDQFWGDRYGQLIDPHGHRWSVAARTRIMTPEEIEDEMKKAFAREDRAKSAAN
jgi:PhnB protein